jgi:hypothetical protein
MLLALFCVAIIQVCDMQGSTHKVPIFFVIVGLPGDLLVSDRATPFRIFRYTQPATAIACKFYLVMISPGMIDME